MELKGTNCLGCDHMKGSTLFPVCDRYLYPDRQHTRIGGCPMRTHDRNKKTEEKGFVDPLKASRRAARGGK